MSHSSVPVGRRQFLGFLLGITLTGFYAVIYSGFLLASFVFQPYPNAGAFWLGAIIPILLWLSAILIAVIGKSRRAISIATVPLVVLAGFALYTVLGPLLG
jgi:hypothetical protein